MIRTNKLALQLAVFTFVAMAAVAQAYPVMPWAAPKHLRSERIPQPSFSVVGAYGGVMENQILIGGASYNMRSGMQAYLLGVGLVPMVEVPIGAQVQAAGAGMQDTGTIRALIVRPADEERMVTDDMSRFVRVRDAASPK